MQIILTHENADFDAVAGLLAASRLYPDATIVLPARMNQNVAQFFERYESRLPVTFMQQRAVRGKVVSLVIVVDTQRAVQIKGIPANVPILILDHHPLGRDLTAQQTFEMQPVGAVTTWLTERLQAAGVALSSIETTLLALGIYEDTGALTYGTTTPRDLRAAAWLMEQGADLDVVRAYLMPPLNADQRALFDQLLASAETRVIEGYPVIVARAAAAEYVPEVSSVAHRLRDTLDPAALFVLVEMPNNLQLVARASGEAVNVGEIARTLGGGGHGRAAAASLQNRPVHEVIEHIWHELHQRVRPVTRIVDLMSYGVHTVDAGVSLAKVVRRLRRIGHEGYPVVEDGRVVGLLTRRDLDRAVEHGLGEQTVRDVMMHGSVGLHAQDSVFALEQIVVESGWGQIPVWDDRGHLIGIVTRTDLIKHWARIHPADGAPAETRLGREQIEAVLGAAISHLIGILAAFAQEQLVSMYMVGGAVRDVLLQRPNLDLDFVVEGDAIRLVEGLQARFGGQVSSFQPFGTAKWRLNEAACSALGVSGGLPETLDFASARNEFYEHPTALPTVYNGSIKLDLLRRDFTINTLAVQVSPAESFGRVLDFYGGLQDLRAGVIRVLHSLSFVDDPTRILRAVRFESRLGFHIEPRTAELIANARPMLARITGERLRNEFDILFGEAEPERAILWLQERGLLLAIDPVFQVPARVDHLFKAARAGDLVWVYAAALEPLYWHVLAALMPPAVAERLGERLLIARTLAEAMVTTSRLVERVVAWCQPELRPSQIVPFMEGANEIGLLAAGLALDRPVARERIHLYWTRWRHVRPTVNGHILRERGLPSGPAYARILSRLRSAWLDGDVRNAEQEADLLAELLREESKRDDGG